MKFSLANENQIMENDRLAYIMLVWMDFLIAIVFLISLIYWAA
jgi:hypothetical protein